MYDIKYVPKFLADLKDKEIVHYKNERLKTTYLVNIIDMFLSKYVFLNSDKISINSQLMKKNYGNKYNLYLDYLLHKKIITIFKNYSTGRHSRIYKITDKTKNSITYIEKQIPQKLKNKINDSKLKTNTVEDHIKIKLITDLLKVNIDKVNAIKWLDEQNLDDRSDIINRTSILKVNNKELFYTFDVYGRLHTNFTTLKKDIRNNFLTINGEKLKEIDITNSQPFFLYLLMKKEGFNKFTDFDKDVLNGTIYDKLSEYENISRNEAKLKVYSVLFGRNRDNTKSNMSFKFFYPKVYKWIKEFKLKHKDYKVVAQMLQKIESKFIFNNLINEIILYNKNIPIITIHDAVLIPERYYDNVKKIFVKELKKLID